VERLLNLTRNVKLYTRNIPNRALPVRGLLPRSIALQHRLPWLAALVALFEPQDIGAGVGERFQRTAFRKGDRVVEIPLPALQRRIPSAA
jgi:hypothetical protein